VYAKAGYAQFMEAISLETTDKKFLITVDKTSLRPEFVMQLIERLRIEQLAEKADFKNDIELLGEDVKSNWWNTNKGSLLATKE
jgi:hypothetical protein